MPKLSQIVYKTRTGFELENGMVQIAILDYYIKETTEEV